MDTDHWRRHLLRVLPVAVLLAIALPAGAASRPRTVTIWFTSGEQFRPVKRLLTPGVTAISPVLRALLAGPLPGEAARNVETQIPAGVTLRSLRLTSAGQAEVELTTPFMAGMGRLGHRSAEQNAEFQARLGQIVYTLTEFSRVKTVRVVAGGQLIADRLSRAQYAMPLAKPAPIVTPPGTPKPGTRALQQRLADLGYLPQTGVDGKSGYQTMQAVLAFQAWERLPTDGVAGPMTLKRLATATRPVGTAGGPVRRIEVYRDLGVTLLITRGRVLRAIHTSAGAGVNATPTGSFTVFRKELRSWSVPFKEWLPLASYFNAGIAFHEYPDVPAQPASHGCIRVPAPDAQQVYAFAANGTVVDVI